jgi:dimethylargininase
LSAASGARQLHALVRPPGDSFASALSSTGAQIDARLAQQQHAGYCQALVQAGVEVEVLPADERYPDSCFMQDPALVIRGKAIIARPGAASRLGEERLMAPLLRQRFPAVELTAPATLEGGDVLVLPEHVYVGRSDRTNAAGIEQLRAALRPFPVDEIPVTGLLHLLSGVTYLGRNTLLAVGGMAGRPEFDGMNVLVVPDEEAYACNVLALGEWVVAPAGYDKTIALLEQNGFRVLPAPVSEFTKADGGVTCLSLIYEESG